MPDHLGDLPRQVHLRVRPTGLKLQRQMQLSVAGTRQIWQRARNQRHKQRGLGRTNTRGTPDPSRAIPEVGAAEGGAGLQAAPEPVRIKVSKEDLRSSLCCSTYQHRLRRKTFRGEDLFRQWEDCNSQSRRPGARPGFSHHPPIWGIIQSLFMIHTPTMLILCIFGEG